PQLNTSAQCATRLLAKADRLHADACYTYRTRQFANAVIGASCAPQTSRTMALSFASLVAAGVDAAPPDAIVRIAAQSVRLVNVVGVAVWIARISKYPRHLACGELICLLDRHEGNVSALSLASGDAAGQRDANRNPQTVYSSHRAPPVRLAQQRIAPRSNPRPDNMLGHANPTRSKLEFMFATNALGVHDSVTELPFVSCPAATPRRMISIASVFARSKALSSSGRPLLRVAISCAALAYCCVVAQIM